MGRLLQGIQTAQMGHRKGHPTMPTFAAPLVVLLLVLEAPAVASVKFVDENSGSATSGRSLFESTRRTLATGMMHAQHVDSPYRLPNMTSLQRAQDAVKSSKQRLNYFSSRTSGRRKTAAAPNEVYTSPVYSSQSYYITTLKVGTPSRTFYFFVDTSSDLIWLQCAPCLSCYKEPSVLYDPSASSTYAEMGCTDDLCYAIPTTVCSTTDACLYDYTYADQSYTYGTLSYETFTLNGTDGVATAFPNLGFGCATNQSGATNSGTFDGFLGLGGGYLSLMTQLDTYFHGRFAYCLVGYDAAINQTSPLLLGGLGKAAYNYTPLLINSHVPSYYYVNLLGIAVNGTQVDIPEGTFVISLGGDGGMILDSSTTITQLFDVAYMPLISNLSALIVYPPYDGTTLGLELCYNTSGVAKPVFPTITFQFEDLDLELDVPNTFMKIDNQSTVYCLFIQSTNTNTGVSIFGNVQQQNFAIGYDSLNLQVGFARGFC